MSKYIIMVLGLLVAQNLFAQGWLVPHHDLRHMNGSNVTASIASLEGGYLMLGSRSNRLRTLRKVDARGQTEWDYSLSGSYRRWHLLQNQVDSTYWVLREETRFDSLLVCFQFSRQGQLLSTQQMTLPTMHYMPLFPASKFSATFTSDNHLLIGNARYNAVDSTSYMAVAKMTLNGQLVWERQYNNTGANDVAGIVDIKERPDGSYLVQGATAEGFSYPSGSSQYSKAKMVLLALDTAGVEQWRTLKAHSHPLGNYHTFEGMIITKDSGALVMSGVDVIGLGGIADAAYAAKFDAQGNYEWEWKSAPRFPVSGVRYPIYVGGAVEHSDGTFTLTGYWDQPSGTLGVLRLSPSGTVVWERGLATGFTEDKGQDLFPDPTNPGNACALRGENARGLFWMGIDSMGYLFYNQITGAYRLDANSNCLPDTNEMPFAGQIITATQNGVTYYGTTDADGIYTIGLDTGAYTLQAQTPTPYWQFCPTPQTGRLDTFFEIDTVNYALYPTINCSYLDVSLSAPFLRRCFNSNYTVSYRNLGTIDALNSYVEVTLDPYLTYVSSGLPIASQSGNTYRFNLGTVPIFGQGQFNITVLVDCDSTALGQVHCTEAQIYPDTFCGISVWTGALIQASSSCTVDSVEFTLENLGAAMSAPQNYTIVEEHVMLRQAPYQLGSGATQTITMPRQHGYVYRIEAEQESGFPAQLGDPIAISNEVACGVLPQLNQPDILGQFYQGNSNPSVAVDCQPNIGAFDPNDKHAQPVGYGPSHFIEKNTPLEYRIRFQNTGTDTAFTVVILDTLDQDLDPATLRMGASSHTYTWSLSGEGILEVRFDNIMLPDSNVNEPLSHGFIKFNIEQDPNLVDGTQLTNKAAIYFDFNAPIITNEVFHTIGTNFVQVRLTNLDQPLLETTQVSLFPNPFTQQATLEVKGQQFETLNIHVYNSMGQQLHTFQGSGNQLLLERHQLPAGIYLYRLEGDDQLIGTGKFIVQ